MNKQCNGQQHKQQGSWALSGLAIAALLTCSLLVAPAQASLIKSYDFDTDLSDTLGNGLDLIASGGTVSGGRYLFAANQGLRLDNALPNVFSYTIEIKFQMAATTPLWKKVMDYQNLSADQGLYIRDSAMTFYNLTGSGGPDSVPVDTDVIARISRDGATGRVDGFLNDTLQWTFTDLAGDAIPGANILNFFEDDLRTGQTEAMVGSVDYIRISVPEPGILGLLGAGLLGLGFSRRRKVAEESGDS